jgi:hypothetical protein
MINNKIRIVRPMRVWFKSFWILMNDIFNPKVATHKWTRYPMYAKDQKEKDLIIASKVETLNQNIKIKNYDL